VDVKQFANELLIALTTAGLFVRVSLETEGPIASGRAYLNEPSGQFLRIYFNEATGTIAFALISGRQRIWGVDHDNRRGWHLHLAENPAEHVAIAPQSITEIMQMLQDVMSGNAQNHQPVRS
jgi:hypothetical protein